MRRPPLWSHTWWIAAPTSGALLLSETPNTRHLQLLDWITISSASIQGPRELRARDSGCLHRARQPPLPPGLHRRTCSFCVALGSRPVVVVPGGCRCSCTLSWAPQLLVCSLQTPWWALRLTAGDPTLSCRLAALAWEAGFLELARTRLTDMASAARLSLTFSAERSIRDEIDRETYTDMGTVALSYAVMLLYIACALGTLPHRPSWRDVLVHSRAALGLGGVLIVAASVVGALGLCSAFGLWSALINLEVRACALPAGCAAHRLSQSLACCYANGQVQDSGRCPWRPWDPCVQAGSRLPRLQRHSPYVAALQQQPAAPPGHAGVMPCHIIVPATPPAGDPFPGAGGWRGQHVHPGPRPAQAGTHGPHRAAHGPRPGNGRPLHHAGSQLRGGGLRHGRPVGDAGRAQLLDLCSAGSCAGFPAAGQWGVFRESGSMSASSRGHTEHCALSSHTCSPEQP